ncbi:tRNA pseudouridine synthase B [Gracilibacillus ureilyticus]|uniref:tRNA pseudouridine synthase B n=1 Tax=Gracilibacillus ureilyticus TaxID=531814 RepID=A0A1H9L997_9BACI|nr:tRNA pseudouridine(55) synthase TruB [Gracilibacillus ureilyticus]SER07593.1 tRNA pseudouridine synthase B [Gracilibacillus ureilyticus]
MNGILPLWKPKGMTSHDCVIKVRKLLKTRKVGHTGTLDPEVEGMLPICIGEATKIVPFLTDTYKTYVATATIGFATDTEDQTGEIIRKDSLTKEINEKEIKLALQSFVGDIIQQVPLYSAVKVNGKKLYEYARNNEHVERPKRTITIRRLAYISTEFSGGNGTQDISFEVECSKGTYVRTLCVDIAKHLGYPGHMSKLVRTKSGHFSKKESITFTQLEAELENIELLPICSGVTHLDTIKVNEEDKQKVKNGQKLPRPDKLPKTAYFRMEYESELLAIYHLHENKQQIKPARVFVK